MDTNICKTCSKIDGKEFAMSESESLQHKDANPSHSVVNIPPLIQDDVCSQ